MAVRNRDANLAECQQELTLSVLVAEVNRAHTQLWVQQLRTLLYHNLAGLIIKERILLLNDVPLTTYNLIVVKLIRLRNLTSTLLVVANEMLLVGA